MIDAGEKWAIVLGVDCVLSRESDKITKAHRDRAEELETEVTALSEKLCEGKIKVTWPAHPNMKKLDEQLRSGFTEMQARSMISGIPTEAQNEYMTIARRQFDFLSMAYPRETIDGLVKPIKVPRSEVDYYRFYGLFRVIDNPLYVFQLISAGGLLEKQAQAIRVTFPSFASFVDESIVIAFENALVKNASFKLPHKIDTGIRDWKRVPVLIKPYQLAYQQENETIGKVPSPKSGESPESKGSLSAAQSALYSQVDGKA